LDLFELAAVGMAQLCARSTQIVRRDMPESCFLAASAHDVPNAVLAISLIETEKGEWKAQSCAMACYQELSFLDDRGCAQTG
jgi:hypothetical protein